MFHLNFRFTLIDGTCKKILRKEFCLSETILHYRIDSRPFSETRQIIGLLESQAEQNIQEEGQESLSYNETLFTKRQNSAFSF